METFWNTIASYNAATWPAQFALTLAAVVLTLLLYFRPSPAVRIAMKVFMALLNFWIAGVYYLVCCEPREHHDLLALFWAIMGCIWVYDLAVGHASLQRTGNHKAFAALLFAMPLVYPLFSLLLGRTFPMITSPVMPCSVAVFTIGLMLAFSERVNIVLAMFLCHWALIGLSKVYFFGIPEDYLLACSIVPALYLFFREYIRDNAGRPTKPSPRVLNALLAVMCLIIGCFFAFTLLHQLNLFTDCGPAAHTQKKRPANRTLLFFAADTAYSVRRRSHLLLAPMTASTRSSP